MVPKYPAARARINRNGSDSSGSEISCDTGTKLNSVGEFETSKNSNFLFIFREASVREQRPWPGVLTSVLSLTTTRCLRPNPRNRRNTRGMEKLCGGRESRETVIVYFNQERERGRTVNVYFNQERERGRTVNVNFNQERERGRTVNVNFNQEREREGGR